MGKNKNPYVPLNPGDIGCAWVMANHRGTMPDFRLCNALVSVPIADRWYCEKHGRAMTAYLEGIPPGQAPAT